MTEKDIIEILDNFYFKQVKYCINNVYVFKYNWESDFLILRKNGYCAEYEIKISKSDFKADFKKLQKHSILETGKYIQKRKRFLKYNEKRLPIYKYWEEEKEYKLRPNKFFYVVPKGLITIEDIPKYTGLIYINEDKTIQVIKEAPFTHKEKLGDKLINILCNKFYYKSRK